MSFDIPLSFVFLKALIYSIILHVMVLFIFNFVVPIKKTPHKPILVFFGALFRNSELSEFSTKQNDHADPVMTTKIPYSLSTAQAPYDDRSVPKPIDLGAIQTQPKITPKIFENTEPNKKTPKISDIEELHLPATPPYKPLRFQTK